MYLTNLHNSYGFDNHTVEIWLPIHIFFQNYRGYTWFKSPHCLWFDLSRKRFQNDIFNRSDKSPRTQQKNTAFNEFYQL